jgi:hypothetical protein
MDDDDRGTEGALEPCTQGFVKEIGIVPQRKHAYYREDL